MVRTWPLSNAWVASRISPMNAANEKMKRQYNVYKKSAIKNVIVGSKSMSIHCHWEQDFRKYCFLSMELKASSLAPAHNIQTSNPMHNIFFEGKTKSFCTKTYQLRGDSASFYHSCKSFCLSVVPSNKRQHRTKTNGHYPPSKLIIQPSLKNPPIISKNIAGAIYLS